MEIKLDKKDFDILKILDSNFRTPLSKIAKKVGLSKNSVALRFEKLKEMITHTTTGINNPRLGYTLVKVFYSFDFLDEMTIKEIKKQFTKHTNLLYVATLYGHYNLEIGLFIKNIRDLISDLEKFHEKFMKKINEKQIQIVVDQFYLGNSFLYNGPSTTVSKILPSNKIITLTKIEKKILAMIRNNPRMSLIEISTKTKLNPKTIASNLRSLEKKEAIIGYFMAVDPSKLGLSTFKLLLRVHTLKKTKEVEDYLISIKGVKHVSRQIGLWDFEADIICENILGLQEEIELLKKTFPNVIKRIEVISFGKRLITSKEMFLG